MTLKMYLVTLLVSLSFCQLLKRVRLTDVDEMYVGDNIVGLAVSWDIRNYYDQYVVSNLLKNSNSMNSWSQTWSISILPTDGTDYQCSATDPYCTQKITMAQLMDFGPWIYNHIPQPGYNAGLQMHTPNATRLAAFIQDFTDFSSYTFLINMGYGVDEYVTKGYRTAGYNITSWVTEINALIPALNITTSSGFIAITGPGVDVKNKNWASAEAADYFSLVFMSSAVLPIFTIRMNFFENDTDATLENLLSESYMRTRINQCLGQFIDFAPNGYLNIDKIKLHYGNGIDGLTNTFAATLWTIDFLMQWMMMGGSTINFDADFNSNGFQSPFNSVNNFTNATTPVIINPIYYGMMLVPFLQPIYGGSIFMKRVIHAYNTTANIKVYQTQKVDAQDLHAVIINKDRNSALQGYVELCYPTNNKAHYFYIEASSLNEKENIYFQGYTFKGTSDGLPSGTKQQYSVEPNEAGCFIIPIKYCQVAVVKITVPYDAVTDEQFNTPVRLWNPVLLSNLMLLILICSVL